jgi:hypothetical protein
MTEAPVSRFGALILCGEFYAREAEKHRAGN